MPTQQPATVATATTAVERFTVTDGSAMYAVTLGEHTAWLTPDEAADLADQLAWARGTDLVSRSLLVEVS